MPTETKPATRPSGPPPKRRRRGAPSNASEAAVWDSILTGNAGRLERELCKGVSADISATVTLPGRRFSEGVATALMLAVELGHNDLAKLLLDRRADVNARRPHNGVTALHIAARVSNVEMIKALAELGACVKTANSRGVTPVWVAARHGHAEAVRVLAELGACVKTASDRGATPVWIAARNGHAEVVRVLTELDACVETSDTNDVTPVWIAARNGHAEVVRVLAELGACVETSSVDDVTPVWIAAQKGRLEVVRVLAELGACVKTPDANGRAPVWIAAMYGRAEVVQVLAELGACVKTPNINGITPVWIAAQEGHAKVIRLLAHLGADITTVCNAGWTSLAISANGAHFESSKTLLLLGAPVAAKDLAHYANALGDTRQLRTDLVAWAAGALAQRRTFCSTFLFGCSVHPSETAVERTVSEATRPLSASPAPPPVAKEAVSTRLADNDGARGFGDTVTTAFGTTVAMTNPVLPMLGGVPGVREMVAAFVGVVVGPELRRARAMGPAIAAIDWSERDM